MVMLTHPINVKPAGGLLLFAKNIISQIALLVLCLGIIFTHITRFFIAFSPEIQNLLHH